MSMGIKKLGVIVPYLDDGEPKYVVFNLRCVCSRGCEIYIKQAGPYINVDFPCKMSSIMAFDYRDTLAGAIEYLGLIGCSVYKIIDTGYDTIEEELDFTYDLDSQTKHVI